MSKIYIFSVDDSTSKRIQGYFHNSIIIYELENIILELKEQKDSILILHSRGIQNITNLLQELQKLDVHTILLEDVPSFENGSNYLRFGINAYGNVIMLQDNLEQALSVVQSNNIWLYPDFISEMINKIPSQEDDTSVLLDKLTPAQKNVALLIKDGLTNKEVATKLDITPRTVKAHLSSIYEKLEVSDRLALAIKLK